MSFNYRLELASLQHERTEQWSEQINGFLATWEHVDKDNGVSDDKLAGFVNEILNGVFPELEKGNAQLDQTVRRGALDFRARFIRKARKEITDSSSQSLQKFLTKIIEGMFTVNTVSLSVEQKQFDDMVSQFGALLAKTSDMQTVLRGVSENIQEVNSRHVGLKRDLANQKTALGELKTSIEELKRNMQDLATKTLLEATQRALEEKIDALTETLQKEVFENFKTLTGNQRAIFKQNLEAEIRAMELKGDDATVSAYKHIAATLVSGVGATIFWVGNTAPSINDPVDRFIHMSPAFVVLFFVLHAGYNIAVVNSIRSQIKKLNTQIARINRQAANGNGNAGE